MRITAVILFSFVFAAFIYATVVCLTWGGSHLSAMGFADYGGSAIGFITAGAASLAGLIILGPRKGLYNVNGKVNYKIHAIKKNQAPLALLSIFLIFIGLAGEYAFSVLASSSLGDVNQISANVFSLIFGMSVGIITAVIISRVLFFKIYLQYLCIGGIAPLAAIIGLTSVTANLVQLALVSFAAVVASILLYEFLMKSKIDDAAGGLTSTALAAGFIGTIFEKYSIYIKK